MGESRNTKRRRSASAWPAARLQQLSLPTSTSSVGQIPAKWKHPSNCQRQNEKGQIQLDLSVDAVTIDGKQMTFGRHDVAEQSQVAIIYKLELYRQRSGWREKDSVVKYDVEDVRCWFKRMLALKLSDTDFEKKFKFDSCHRLEPDEFVINEPNHLASGDASSLNHKPQESY